MPNDIITYIKNLPLDKFDDFVSSLQPRASFFRGRKFFLSGYDGDLKFNEIVFQIYQKAVDQPQKVKALDLHGKLLKIDALGNAELAQKSWWIRLATYLKHLFTYSTRFYYLHKMEQLGYASLYTYCKERAGEVIGVIAAMGTKGAAVVFQSKYYVDYGKHRESVLVNLNIPQSPSSSHYEGVEAVKVEIDCQTDRTFNDQFQSFLNGLRRGLPFWLKTRELLDNVAAELKSHAEKKLVHWRAQKTCSEDCVIDNIKMTIDLDCANGQTSKLTYQCILKCLKNGNVDQSYELLLSKIVLVDPNEDRIKKLSYDWLHSIDAKMISFLQSHIENEPKFSDQREKIFADFFGDDFTSFFGESSFDQSGSATITTVEDHLKTMETLLKEPDTLLPLLNDKKYDELAAALKKMWKKGALKLHPDKLQHKGLSDQELKDANDAFKRFGQAYQQAAQWVCDSVAP